MSSWVRAVRRYGAYDYTRDIWLWRDIEFSGEFLRFEKTPWYIEPVMWFALLRKRQPIFRSVWWGPERKWHLIIPARDVTP